MKYVLLLLLLFSYRHSSRNLNYVKIIDYQQDTIPRDIPLTLRGVPHPDYEYKNKFEKILNLNTLENGVDSVEIRIWFNYSFIDTSQLIILKNNNYNWSAELYSFVYKSDTLSSSLKLVSVCKVKKTPKSGWNSFIKNIYALNIASLPDYSAIPEYSPYTDGNGVSVEVSTAHEYRIFGYQLPYINDPIPKSVQNIQSIIGLINHEFDFKPLRSFLPSDFCVP